MDKPFVRRYQPEDYDRVLEIFHETIGDNIKFEPAWTISSYVWCIPYLKLSPSTCFVLDDGSGKAVGYILGTAFTSDFVDKFRTTFLPSLDRNLMPDPGSIGEDLALDWEGDVTGSLLRILYNPEKALLYSAKPTMVAEHPAISILTFFHVIKARVLAVRWLSLSLKGSKVGTNLPHDTDSHRGDMLTLSGLGATGCFIIPPASNTGAVRFYKRHGFQLFGEVMDDGLSGQPGHLKDGSICLVHQF